MKVHSPAPLAEGLRRSRTWLLSPATITHARCATTGASRRRRPEDHHVNRRRQRPRQRESESARRPARNAVFSGRRTRDRRGRRALELRAKAGCGCSMRRRRRVTTHARRQLRSADDSSGEKRPFSSTTRAAAPANETRRDHLGGVGRRRSPRRTRRLGNRRHVREAPVFVPEGRKAARAEARTRRGAQRAHPAPARPTARLCQPARIRPR